MPITLTTIPNEVLLAIFGEFHLPTLIHGRAVCRKWRDLLPLADIQPIRRALLDLFNEIIEEPWFLDGRPWVLENLSSFDREAYVDALLAQHNYLPVEFRIWILEWPAKAAFAGIWPGLPPFTLDLIGPSVPRRWRDYWNLMDPSKPIVRTINAIRSDVDPDFDLDPSVNMDLTDYIQPLPGLPIIMEEGDKTTWLILDEGNYRDLVIRTCESNHEFRASIQGYQVAQKRWIDCLQNKAYHLCDLYRRGQKREYPFVFDTEAPSEMIKLSSSCTPWSSSSHTPYLRSVDYISDDGEEEEEL
ncbi:hypothetical protein ONZ45_g17810 [Pleurotus djamor]|nr:hypothetical protein ONZ45_g17810 [Pleurotus djamor]